MGLINGALTYKKYRIDSDIPKNLRDLLADRLPRHGFREIDPKVNPEFSIGWVNVFDPLDAKLALEKVLFGKYIILGLRRDKKTLPGALFKARFTEALRAQARERKGRKLSREEMAALKENVRNAMLSAVMPAMAVYEVVWNYETHEVFFSSGARKAADEFAEVFEESFGLALAEQTLVSRAEAYIDANGLGVDLAAVESAHFGR